MINIEIGQRIKQRRKALNISVVDIANHTGLSKATIHRYESGDIKDIKLPILEKVATILDVEPAWLIGKSENTTRREGKTTNLLFALDHVINFVNSASYLTVGTRKISVKERMTVIKVIQLAKELLEKDIIDKGE